MKINYILRRPQIEPRPLEMPRCYPRGLTRTFVETGDERCPMAGIWTCMASPDTAGDDPELATPATRMLLWWRAFHGRLTPLRYSVA